MKGDRLDESLAFPSPNGYSRSATLLSEKRPTDHGIVSRRPSDVDFCVPGNVPNQVHAIGEAGNAPRIQHRAGVRIQDLNGFRSRCAVPIHSVERKLMCISIFEIEIKTKARTVVPSCRNPSH